MAQPKSRKKSRQQPEYNGWRVLNTFVEGIIQLINSNRVYPAFGLVILAIMGMVVYRLPESELAEIIKILLNEIVVAKGGLIFLLIATNLGWMYLLKRLRSMYTLEIERLAKIRSGLMHSTSNIEQHRSSNESQSPSFIWDAGK